MTEILHAAAKDIYSKIIPIPAWLLKAMTTVDDTEPTTQKQAKIVTWKSNAILGVTQQVAKTTRHQIPPVMVV